MKRFNAILWKEFRHVFRDSKTMLMLFGLPVIQILLFGFALSHEIKKAPILVVDQAVNASSHKIIEKFRENEQFELVNLARNIDEIKAEFFKGRIQMAVVIPADFEASHYASEPAGIQLIADASNPNIATNLVRFATGIIREIEREWSPQNRTSIAIRTETSMIYNPDMSSATTFVPGLIALILLLVCVLMTSVSIVREKEQGHMEVLLVSPMHPVTFVLAKATPYLALSLINLGVILAMSIWILHIPIAGSMVLLFIVSMLLILTALALGLWISTVTRTQETAMMFALLGMLLPTLLFTGFMFPIENMPVALQYFSFLVPSRWYYSMANDIMIKGLGFGAVWKEILILGGMTILLLGLSIRGFKHRLI